MPIPESNNVSAILLLTMGFVGIICTLFTVGMIQSMNRWNSYILLVASLTIAQLLYDLSVILVMLPGLNGYTIDVFIRVFSGVISTLLTNVISTAVLYVMLFHASVNIFKWYKYIMAFLVSYSSLHAIPITLALRDGNEEMLTNWSYLYQATRIISICLNILMYIYIQVIVTRRGYTAKRSSNYDPAGLTHVYADPVVLLSDRMKYYPVVQVITRVCVAFFEFKYGYVYDYNASTDPLYRASAVLYALTLPSAAIGYFVVFLSVTPGAKSHLLNGFRRVLGLKEDSTYDNEKNRFKNMSRSNTRSGLRSPSGASAGVFAANSVHSNAEELSEVFLDNDTDSDTGESYQYREGNVQSIDKSEVSYASGQTTTSYNFKYCDEDQLSKAIVDLYNENGHGKRNYSFSNNDPEVKNPVIVTSDTFVPNSRVNNSTTTDRK